MANEKNIIKNDLPPTIITEFRRMVSPHRKKKQLIIFSTILREISYKPEYLKVNLVFWLFCICRTENAIKI